MLKKPRFRIILIGAGNVASHLGPALERAGHMVQGVYSRQPEHARQLTQYLYQAQPYDTLDFSATDAQLFIIAVSDDAIPEVVAALQLPEEALLVHTSGSQPLSVLKRSATPRVGVFYPLQTFSKHHPLDFHQVPICLESEDSDTLYKLTKLAKSISGHVALLNSQERRVLHVAAVFASNFTNHMLRMAETLAEAHQLDYELLKPLIEETIRKSLATSPEQAQTGPAVRGDARTIKQHQAFLKKFDPDYAKVYRVITQHIMKDR